MFCYFDIKYVSVCFQMKWSSFHIFFIQFSTNQNSWRETSVDSDKFKVVLNLFLLYFCQLMFISLCSHFSDGVYIACYPHCDFWVKIVLYMKVKLYRTQVLFYAFCLFGAFTIKRSRMCQLFPLVIDEIHMIKHTHRVTHIQSPTCFIQSICIDIFSVYIK